MNIFEKLHRKLFPNDYVTSNVVSYAFLLMAEDLASGAYQRVEGALNSATRKFQLTIAAQIHLADEIARYMENFRGGVASNNEELVVAFCLLSAIAESEDEECQK